METRRRTRQQRFAWDRLDELRDLSTRLSALDAKIAQLRARNRRQRLRALVSGTVTDLAIRTPGVVVTPAQVLMRIVPDDPELRVEAVLPNRDVAAVHPGQRAVVKIDAYPFTRYGTLKGTVETVSADALADGKGAAFRSPLADPPLSDASGYRIRIRLEPSPRDPSSRSLRLAPGMGATVEIVTGRRTVLDFFLAPVLEQLDAALDER